MLQHYIWWYNKINRKKVLKVAKIISCVAFKGGVGKTSSTAMIGFELAKRGYKTLMVDTDPQANLTSIALRTRLAQGGSQGKLKASLMKAVEDKNLTEALVHIMSKLDLIGSSMDFSLYPQLLAQHFEDYDSQVQYLSELLEPVAKDYDFVVLDTSPGLSIFQASVLYASDYALCLMKTDPYSMQGLTNLLEYIQSTVIDQYHAPKLQPLGVLPVMMQRGSLDKGILEMVTEKYGKDSLLPVITYMSRINRYSATGITDSEYFDKRPHQKYGEVVDEILERVND